MEYPPKHKQTDKPTGSTTNASDAVDDVEIKADADEEDVLDEGLQETFPASDPIAVGTAHKKRKAKKGS